MSGGPGSAGDNDVVLLTGFAEPRKSILELTSAKPDPEDAYLSERMVWEDLAWSWKRYKKDEKGTYVNCLGYRSDSLFECILILGVRGRITEETYAAIKLKLRAGIKAVGDHQQLMPELIKFCEKQAESLSVEEPNGNQERKVDTA